MAENTNSEKAKIIILPIEVVADPSTIVYNVELTNPGRGSWLETMSKVELKIWLQGLRVGANLFGAKHYSVPAIPDNDFQKIEEDLHM